MMFGQKESIFLPGTGFSFESIRSVPRPAQQMAPSVYKSYPVHDTGQKILGHSHVWFYRQARVLPKCPSYQP